KGILQSSGITWYWYNDCGCDTPTAWGAYGVMVNGEPIDYTETYRVVTNDFLAGGKDGWVTFAEGTNRWNTYYDMQEAVNEYIGLNSPISPTVEGRIVKLDKVVTILHTNDEHGRAYTDTYRGQPNGFTYLYSLIKHERAKNPNVLLMSASDTIQGNAFAFYFRNAPGPTPGDTTELGNPIMAAMNLMGYDVSTIGNHEYNFGNLTFAKALGQAEFPFVAANVEDDGRYGFIADNVVDYVTFDVEGLKVAVLGMTNPRVPRYELPSNIVGLTFSPAIDTAATKVPQVLAAEDPDLMVLLTHIGYSPWEEDYDRDTEMAKQVPGIDVIVGGHSHTRLDPATIVTSDVNPEGTLIAQAYKYATYLGKATVGFTGNETDGYEIVFREGRLLPAGLVEPDPELEALMQPYLDELNAYSSQEIGESLVDLDARTAFYEETACSNLQVDASKWVLEQADIEVDFHLSGAMSNRYVPAGPLTVGDMFTLMPYENSLVVMRMNGPQIKYVLERSFYNYDLWRQGKAKYTTCFLDISEGGQIIYAPTVPEEGDNVIAVLLNGEPIDLTDPDTYYNVSTVNYLAAGSCAYRDDTVSIWPLDQIVADTQYYVRDAVIDYVRAFTPIAPQVENRLVFATPTTVTIQAAADATGYVRSQELLENHFGSQTMWAGQIPQGAGRGKWYGTVQFDLSDIPSNAVIASAEVELTGAPEQFQLLDPRAGGQWSLKLLDSDVDLGWLGLSYWDIAVMAGVEETIGPTLSYADLGPGVVNTFTFSPAQLDALAQRVATTGRASFRIDYEATLPGLYRDLFAWDATAPPVLRVSYYTP
ncbi:MAG: 5'-nucleotidase C-terminal domain-containing protein, partial [Anaerolineae bacterium]